MTKVQKTRKIYRREQKAKRLFQERRDASLEYYRGDDVEIEQDDNKVIEPVNNIQSSQVSVNKEDSVSSSIPKDILELLNDKNKMRMFQDFLKSGGEKKKVSFTAEILNELGKETLKDSKEVISEVIEEEIRPVGESDDYSSTFEEESVDDLLKNIKNVKKTKKK